MLEWQKLATTQRHAPGDSTIHLDVGPVFQEHERDSDRILFSSAFRRLQGKTQVYIFPHTDYVRNRLTHSIEVASIGKALANEIFKEIGAQVSKELPEKVTVRNLVDIVVAACYAHDIGNPPFGHIGEYAIRSWFVDKAVKDKNSKFSETIGKEESQKNDFLCFDGNAQSLRIVTKLQGWPEKRGGLQLTYATLGALIKYPYSSTKAPDRNKKFGYYCAEKKTVESIFYHTGQSIVHEGISICARHPLNYIMEAADDIAYATADVEDGVKFRLISRANAEEALYNVARISGVNQARVDSTKPNSQDRIKYLRSAAVVSLIKICARSFVDNYDRIMRPDNHLKIKDLFSLFNKEDTLKMQELKNLSTKYIYNHELKVVKEAGAYEVIRFLLDSFDEVVQGCSSGKTLIELSYRNNNLRRIIQPKYDIDAKGDYTNNHEIFADNYYDGYIKLIDFISGMTDRYAYEMYGKISGNKLNSHAWTM